MAKTKRNKIADAIQEAGAEVSQITPFMEEAPQEEPKQQQEPANNELLATLKAMQKELAALKEEKAAREENERKTKRVNLLIRPSVYNESAKVAKSQRISFNEYVERCLLECNEKAKKKEGEGQNDG